MPRSNKKADRKAAYTKKQTQQATIVEASAKATPAIPSVNAQQLPVDPIDRDLDVNWFHPTFHLANLACGLTGYRIVVPKNLKQARSLTPNGPKSQEYAPSHAISTRNDIFHPEKNWYGRQPMERVIADVNEFLAWSAKKEAHKQRIQRGRERQARLCARAQEQMGDFEEERRWR